MLMRIVNTINNRKLLGKRLNFLIKFQSTYFININNIVPIRKIAKKINKSEIKQSTTVKPARFMSIPEMLLIC